MQGKSQEKKKEISLYSEYSLTKKKNADLNIFLSLFLYVTMWNINNDDLQL